MRFLKLLLPVFLLTIISCGDSISNENTGLARLSVKLVDDPGDYENVFVEIVDVMIKYQSTEDNGDDESGWESLGILDPGIYDLLELTGGVSLDLINNENIVPGTIKQIRLVLGDDNTIVLEDQTEAIPLNTPSGQQSGLKVMVNQQVFAGLNYDFILDFDVDESIIIAGNSGNYNLKPVLRASLEVNSGIIVGAIEPVDVVTEIEATDGIITASTMTDPQGNFELLGLPGGIYTVTITPDDDSMLNSQVIENVQVVVGETTNLETISLQ